MAVIPWAISSGVLELGVVGPDHEHDHLGLDSIELAVLNPPENMLGSVAADAEVGRFPGPIEPLPDVVVVPPLSDRIAQKEQVDISLLRLVQEPPVQLHPGAFPRRGNDRRRGPGRKPGFRSRPG